MTLENKEVFSKNLNYYMEKYGISRNELRNELGLKYMTLSDWINGKTYPRIEKIELLANFFGINKSDLIENKREINSSVIQMQELYPPISTLRWDEEQLLEYYNNSNHIGRDRIMTVAEEMNELYPEVDRNKILQSLEIILFHMSHTTEHLYLNYLMKNYIEFIKMY